MGFRGKCSGWLPQSRAGSNWKLPSRRPRLKKVLATYRSYANPASPQSDLVRVFSSKARPFIECLLHEICSLAKLALFFETNCPLCHVFSFNLIRGGMLYA